MLSRSWCWGVLLNIFLYMQQQFSEADFLILSNLFPWVCL
jgi:hypothetical protein